MTEENNRNSAPQRATIMSLLDNRRLTDALSQLKSLSEKQLSWEITDRLKTLEQTYGYMMRYALDGADDPGRKRMLGSLIDEAYTTLDLLQRTSDRLTTSTLYFGTLRFEQVRVGENLPSLIDKYLQLAAADSPFSRAADESDSPEVRRKNLRLSRESLERRLFMKLWTTFPLSSADFDALLAALTSREGVPQQFRQLMISATLLGALAYYDSRRLDLLLRVYSANAANEASADAATALTAAVIVTARYTHRPFTSQVEAALDVARQSKSWIGDLRCVFTELVRARDTDRINRKMMEDVVPTLMKLRPDLLRHNIDPAEMADLEAIEENPEWREMLDKSGITDKIKEMTEIQEEGGDVFMSTFAHLKSFPFFREPANWFVPFTAENSAVEIAGDELSETIASVLEASPFLCNSDKFSFILSLRSVPEQQRKLMLDQMNAFNVNSAEMRAATANAFQSDRRNFVNKYVQDLYRFFKLFDRADEFENPFDGGLQLLGSPMFADLFKVDKETLRAIGEFYFKHGYRAEALEAFRMLEQESVPSSQIYQKIGFCYEKLGEIESALDYYLKAELVDSQSVWTLKRIAHCYRLLGDDSQALAYYERIAAIEPENAGVAFDTAISLMALRRYANAVTALRKVLYLNPNHTRGRRLLVRALFMLGKVEAAYAEGRKLLDSNPERNDYITLALTSLILKHYREAADLMHLAVETGNCSIDNLIEAINRDRTILDDAGVDPDMTAILLDSLPR